MTTSLKMKLPVSLFLTACSSAPESSPRQKFDLEITRTAPYATWLLVTPASRGADLPKLSRLKSRDFVMYFREQSGCAVNTLPEIFVLGDKRAPAGYMVPAICP